MKYVSLANSIRKKAQSMWRVVGVKDNSLLFKIAVQILESDHVRASHKDAFDEYQKLCRLIKLERKPPYCVWVDQSESAPGFGDLLIAIALANQLSELGFATSFFWTDDSDSATKWEKSETIANFLSKQVSILSQAQLDDFSADSIVFNSRVCNNLDVSVPAFQLLALINMKKNQLIAPQAPIWPIEIRKESAKQNGPIVGIHVRRSPHALFRNPSDKLTIRDIKKLSKLIVNAQLRWFGELEHFISFTEKYSRKLTRSRVRLTYQESRGFSRAALEALGCDFWFQRWGGGIGAALWFWHTPYLMISNDHVLRRVYKPKGRKIVSWAKNDQVYDLRWVRSRQGIKRRFVQITKK